MVDKNKKYHIYHIAGKKIGVTCNLTNRVTKQQGYKTGFGPLENSDNQARVACIPQGEE